MSAVIYLTLGVLCARAVGSTTAKAYCLAVAGLLTFLVGVSRVYLGRPLPH